METITDAKGKEHKVISNRIDDMALLISAINIGRIFSGIQSDISEETSKLFQKLIKSLEKDVGHIQCDEYIGLFAVEQGYNFDD